MIYNYPYYNESNENIQNNYLKNFSFKNDDFNNKKNTINNYEKNQTESRNASDDNIINIFGIELAFDELIILSLLFLLYTEDVKDIGLYMVLILLLLN